MTDIPRISAGHPAGGQFRSLNRPEAALSLTPALSEHEQKRLDRSLFRARNALGNPLSTEARARLVAVATEPNENTWEHAYALVLAPRAAHTLWQAVLRHTEYPVMARPSGTAWSEIPTRQQIMLALDLATRDSE
tara:strand:- start:7468 stop:7872 length:405 start_codon:yes stop_codon:yes gene_type:complete